MSNQKIWVRDQIAELKHQNRLLKKLAHDEYEKLEALEKEERKFCRAIIRRGNEYIVCGHEQCEEHEHINRCQAVLRGGKRKGEFCNVENCPIKAHKNPNATRLIKETKWNQFVKEHWDDVSGDDFKTRIRKLSCLYNEQE